MKYTIAHESKNSIRIRCESLRNMTADEADILRFELMNDPGIQKVDLYRKTGGVRITYDCPRSEIIKLLNILDIEDEERPQKENRDGGGGRSCHADSDSAGVPSVSVRDIEKAVMSLLKFCVTV